MARPFRFAAPWQPVEVTARTIQGRFLLAPSPRLNRIMAGILAIGRARYQVRIHNFVFLSNHFHLILSAANPGESSRFMNFVMSNIAREAGRLHEWEGPFWGRRHRTIPIAGEPALLDRMRYVFSNGCKEGLVSHPAKWWGLSAVTSLLDETPIEGVWVDRTAFYRASRSRSRPPAEEDFATTHLLSLDPLPGWEELNAETRRARLAGLVTDVVATLGSQPPADFQRAPVGPRHPHHRPSRVKRMRAPLCHADSRFGRRSFLEAYRAFADAYRRASEHLRQNLQGHGYPPHSQVLAFLAPG